MKAQGAPLYDSLILRIAKEKAEELGIQPFSGSGGWLSNFKHRQAVRIHLLHPESDAANVLTSLAQSMLPGTDEVNPCLHEKEFVVVVNRHSIEAYQS